MERADGASRRAGWGMGRGNPGCCGGREWGHAEYDFAERGGSHCDISIYGYIDFRACRPIVSIACTERDNDCDCDPNLS